MSKGIPMKNLLSENHQNDSANPALDVESFLTYAMARRGEDFGEFFWSKLSGDELVEMWRDGSSEQRRMSVRRLLERYEPSAFLVCNILLENPDEAALACEDACVDAIGKMELETLADVSAFRVILFSAVHRHCANFESMAMPDSNADFRVERSTVVDLAAAERSILALRFFADLSRDEIALVMQVPSADVRAGLWNAMQSVIKRGFYPGYQHSDTAA